MVYDSIIVGGGPGGLSSALNLCREGYKVLILEKENFGGQIANSPRVENIPGIKSISGADFSSSLFDQVTVLGAEFELEDVLSINKVNDLFEVQTNYNKYTSKTIVLATGCAHKMLNNPTESKYFGNGVSYCAVCDGAFYASQTVIVIGDANTALQYALLLSNYCKKVIITTLFDKFFADSILIDKMKSVKNIEYFHNLNTKEFYGNNTLEGVRFENTKTHEIVDMKCTGAFIAIGQIPCNSAFKNLVELDKDGYIVANEFMHTKTPGVYAIGDCRTKKYRQVVTAASDGSISALEIQNYLK